MHNASRRWLAEAALVPALVAVLLAAPAGAGDWWQPEYTEVFGEVELEGTGFFEAPQFAGQSRGDDALNAFQNDLILGTRLALNDPEDTSVLVTGAIDTTDGGIALRLEAERRLSEQWKAQIESVGFVNQDKSGPSGAFADDSFVRLKLTYFF